MNSGKPSVAGLDEAGRGPVLGPLVLCGALLDRKVFKELNAERVRDSKKIGPHRRAELAELIAEKAERYEIVEFEPSEIDRLRLEEGVNLNEIEAIGFSRLINRLNPTKVYVDSAGANARRFAKMIRKRLGVKTELIVEHGADSKYLPVSAASIIAKVRRDRRLEELSQIYGELGSGYPADDRTIRFLKRWIRKHGKLPDFTRKSWMTARRIRKTEESRTPDVAQHTNRELLR